MIAAVEAGADVYCQKPISVDVVEGQAMVAAARKHGRVVQVGTQRPQHAPPHRSPRPDHQGRQARQDRFRRDLLLLSHAGQGNPPDLPPPDYLDWEAWTGPAPMRPYNTMIHPRGWRSFKEYGNGILGDMCIHMLDMVRWMLGLGWPRRIASTGGILVDKNSKANVPDTQTATFDFGDLDVVWEHRTWGQEVDPKYPWGATIYGDKGTLEAERLQLRLHPATVRERRSTRTSSTSWSSIPRTRPRKTWSGTSPRPSAATCSTSWRPSSRAASRSPTSRRATSRRRAASWPTSRSSSAERSPGTPRRAASATMKRPTGSCVGPTASPGFIPRSRRPELVSEALQAVLEWSCGGDPNRAGPFTGSLLSSLP